MIKHLFQNADPERTDVFLRRKLEVIILIMSLKVNKPISPEL